MRFRRSPAGIALVLAAILHLWMLVSLIGRVEDVRHGRTSDIPTAFGIFHDAQRRWGPGADFFALYHAGVALEEGASIYGPSAEHETPFYYPYRYLPAFAQSVGRLVERLEPWPAYYVWVAFLEGLVLAILWMVRSLFDRDEIGPWVQALVLAFTPLWLELWMGQFTLLMGTLLLACGVALRSSRRWLALLAWAAAVGVKIVPAVLLPLWWRMGLLARAAGVLAVLALFNVPGFLEPGRWSEFVAANFGNVAAGPHDAGNHGFAYLSYLSLVHGFGLQATNWSELYAVLQLAWLGAACGIVCLQRRVAPLPSLALLILAHQLSYMHVWEHHATLVLALGILLLAESRGPRERAVILGSLVILGLPTPFTWMGPPEQWSLLQRMLPAAAKSLPALALFLVAARACLAPAPAPAPGPTAGPLSPARLEKQA